MNEENTLYPATSRDIQVKPESTTSNSTQLPEGDQFVLRVQRMEEEKGPTKKRKGEGPRAGDELVNTKKTKTQQEYEFPSNESSPKKAPVSITEYNNFLDKAMNYAFVDKTILIKNVMSNGYMTETVLRPRRFGKSLNLTMLKYYLSILEEQNYEKYFKGTKIYEEKEFYAQHGNRYPVIHLNFGNFSTVNDTPKWPAKSFKSVIKLALKPYYKILNASTELDEMDKDYLKELRDPEEAWENSLHILSLLLKNHYHKDCIVLIDEYDYPINNLLDRNEDLEKLREYYKTFIQSGLKGNTNVCKSVMTGVAKVAQSSIFSGLNNSIVDSFVSSRYNDYYGFSQEEVTNILKQTKNEEPTEDELEKVKAYYNGFRSSEMKELYNPYSIMNYADKRTFENFWNYTASEKMLLVPYVNLTEGDLLSLKKLVIGDSIKKVIRANMSSDEVSGADQFWSLLFYSGYLTFSTENTDIGYDKELSLKLVNQESLACLKRIEERFYRIDLTDSGALRDAFAKNNPNNFIKVFNSSLKQDKKKNYINGRTLSGELGYHNLIYWNLREHLTENWILLSEGYVKEGKGYFDILVISREKDMAYILEIKFLSKENSQNIEAAFQQAFDQIEDKQYAKYFTSEKYLHIKSVQYIAIVGCDLELYSKSGRLITINN